MRAIAVGFIHSPDLAEADQSGTFLRCLSLLYAKNHVGVRQADDVLCAIVAICFSQACKIVEPEKEGATKAAGGLQPSLKRRQLMKRGELVDDKPGTKLPCVLERHDRVDRDIHPQCERSEEHTSELQSLMRISYAVFCLKKKNTTTHYTRN